MKLYRNLTRRTWSIKDRVQGKEKVVGYTQACYLYNGIKFIVQEAGRQRVLATRRKFVHAFVSGEFFSFDGYHLHYVDVWTLVSYNPYRGGNFVRQDTHEPVFAARAVYFHGNGQVWAAF